MMIGKTADDFLFANSPPLWGGHAVLLPSPGEDALEAEPGRVLPVIDGTTQMAIKKSDDYVQCVLGLRDIHIVKKTVKKPFPHMEFGVDSQLH